MLKPNPDEMKFAIKRSGREYASFQKKWSTFDKWIEGTASPTLKQIQEFAGMVFVPVSDLFSDVVPSYELPIPDCRTIGNIGVTPSPELYDTIMMMLWRQDWLRDYFEEDECDPVLFVSSIPKDSIADSQSIAAAIREFFSLKHNWAASLSTPSDAFRFLRRQVEQTRISVAVNGHVGNNTHRPLSVSEFRGFVLADKMAPLIFVNGADADTAKCFTLFHELAHLALDDTGVVNPDESSMSALGVERLCNRVAAEMMVPEELLRNQWPSVSDRLYSSVKDLAQKFKASIPMIMIRAKELQLITQAEADETSTRYAEELGGAESSPGKGGSYYATKGVELGSVFAASIDAGIKAGRLSYTEAFQLTGLNRKTFDTFFEMSR